MTRKTIATGRLVRSNTLGYESLPGPVQRLTLAIAQYADRTGYALAVEDDEERLVSAINDSIQAQFALGGEQDGLIGSLMTSAMYGALRKGFAGQADLCLDRANSRSGHSGPVEAPCPILWAWRTA